MRDYQINGESLVVINFGKHVASQYGWQSGQILGPEESTDVATVAELGLCSEPIQIMPQFKFRDVNADAFGPNCPSEVLANLATCRIRMQLIHYDPFVAAVCQAESLGGAGSSPQMSGQPAMIMPGAGRPLWAGRNVDIEQGRVQISSGCRYMSIGILQRGYPVGSGLPHRFPTAYLSEQPTVLPLSTKASIMTMEWRVVPVPRFVNEALSQTSDISPGAAASDDRRSVLWDHGILRSGDHGNLSTGTIR